MTSRPGTFLHPALRTSLDVHEEMVQALFADIHEAFDQASTSDTQINRRNACRGLFACIEGVVFAMKYVALGMHEARHYHFRAEEVLLLKEMDIDLSESGKAKPRRRRLPVRRNLKFAFHAFARAQGSDFAIDTNDPGWQGLVRSVEVRNRLMHPKSLGDLHVTDQEVADLRAAAAWFTSMWTLSMVAAIKAALARGDELKRRIAEASPNQPASPDEAGNR